MGAFETVLASWLCHLINSFAGDKKLGLAVSEVLFVLNAARDLKRRPDVAFVSYARWPTPVVARESAWKVVPDLAVELVSPTNLAEEIDRKITDYFQSGVRLVWAFYPDSGRVYVLSVADPSQHCGTHRHLGRRRGPARFSAPHCAVCTTP